MGDELIARSAEGSRWPFRQFGSPDAGVVVAKCCVALAYLGRGSQAKPLRLKQLTPGMILP